MKSRPSTYCEAKVTEIIRRVSDGETLKAVARELGIAPATFHAWRIRDEQGLVDRYARAREAQAEAWSDEIISVAYNQENDTITKVKDGIETEIANTEWINRSRLKVDALKWLMAKLHPRQYGEKVEQTVVGKDGGPVQYEHSLASILRSAKK